MRTETRLGTFEDIIRPVPPHIAAIAHRLRDLIAAIYADVVELPRPAEQHARYAIGADKAQEVFGYICPMQSYVRLGLYYGGTLPDPNRILEGTGKRLRHIKIDSIADVDRPDVRRLLEAAVRERQQALGAA
jgi:hypothetical protein